MMKKEEPKLISAKGAAFQIIQSLGMSSPLEVSLEDIAMSRGVLVMDGNLEGAEARLVRKGDRGIIRVKQGISEIGRRRFALSHELGHWELHKNQSQWNACSENELHDYTNSNLEIEANAFAAELLMPTSLFRPRCESEEPSLNLLKRLADEFQSTLTATAIRFVEEIRQPCMVIFSKDGVVQWWRKSDKSDGLWIEKNWALKKESDAWECTQGRMAESSKFEFVEPETWFNEEVCVRTERVYEQSMRLGRYPTVLTLLSLSLKY